MKFEELNSKNLKSNNKNDIIENDFLLLKKKFNLSDDPIKGDILSNLKLKIENSLRENETNKRNNVLDDIDYNDSTEILSKMLQNMNKKNPKNMNIKKDSSLIREPDNDSLLKNFKNLNFDKNQNEEATSNIFKKFLSENIQKIKKTNNNINNSQEVSNREKNETKFLNNRRDNESKNNHNAIINKKKKNEETLQTENLLSDSSKNEFIDQLDLNDLSFYEKTKNLLINPKEKYNLDSIKDLLKKSSESKAKSISESDLEEKNNLKNETKLRITEQPYKENGKKEFNFSLGDIESQIEILKNLSIKS